MARCMRSAHAKLLKDPDTTERQPAAVQQPDNAFEVAMAAQANTPPPLARRSSPHIETSRPPLAPPRVPPRASRQRRLRFTTLGTLQGVQYLSQGETTFDAINKRYFNKTNLGITIINAQTGTVIDTIANPIGMKGIEYDPNSNRLLGSYWNGSVEKFISLNLSTKTYTTFGILQGVQYLSSGVTTFDSTNKMYFNMTNLGITKVSEQLGPEIAQTIETRCVCESIFNVSPSSAPITTVPGTCPVSCNYSYTISDPCICNNNATLAGNDGTFNEVITVTGTTGQIITGTCVGCIPTSLVFTESSPGTYVSNVFMHIDNIGYTSDIFVNSIFNGTIGNKCAYPNVTINNIGPFFNCQGQPNVPLTANITGDNGSGSYSWSGAGVTGSYFNPSNLPPGNVVVSLNYDGTNGGNISPDGGNTPAYPGCIQPDTSIIMVNLIPVPVITVTDNSGVANNDGILCAGATATLTASGGGTYLWSTGATTAAITTGAAGTYTVTVTNLGCVRIYRVNNNFSHSITSAGHNANRQFRCSEQ